MKFSIICKDGDMAVRLNGSTFELASLITEVMLRNNNVKNIIMLSVVALKAEETGELDEFYKHNANH
jgi:hypothetical protein